MRENSNAKLSNGTPTLTHALLGAGGLALLAAYALAIEPYAIQVTRPEIPAPNLPDALDGATILLLTDPHVGVWGLRERYILDILRRLAGETPPDLIVWGGDYLLGNQAVAPALRLLAEAREIFPDPPTYAILGNAEHKLTVAPRRAMLCKMREMGYRLLINEWEPFLLRDETINLVGVDDPYYGHADLVQALGDAPVGERFTLLLSHSPQIAVQAARYGVDLMLSGHTHGGQVRFPFIGALRTQNPLSRLVDQGYFDRARMRRALGGDPGGDMATYISRGVGSANVPKFRSLTPRFLCPPEIALLTLRKM